MTLILVNGKSEAKFLIHKETAEKTVIVDGHANTTIQQMTPLEANREVNRLLRLGWRKKEPAKVA
jgi:hypothetical protein